MGNLFTADSLESDYAVERRLANITIAVAASPETVAQSIETLCSRRKGIEKLLNDAIALHGDDDDGETPPPQQQQQPETDFVANLKARLTSLDADILTLRRMKLEAEAAEIISGRRDAPPASKPPPKQKKATP